MDSKQRINKFNTENRPFYIVDHKNGEYSLCLAFSFLEGKYKNFGQEAFNRYAMEAGESVLENGRWFRHGNGHEWQIVFEKAFEGDPNSDGIKYDCEAGGFFCYAKSLSLIEDFGTRFRAICMDEERFTGLVCTALKEDAERESRMERIQGTIRGFLTENPQCDADIMTSDGLVQLTAGQGKQLLDGSLKTVTAGDLKIDAEGLLCQKISDMQQDLFRVGHFQIRTRVPEQVVTQSMTM